MSAPLSKSSSNHHPLFNKEKVCSEKEMKLDFISSIWDDDRIQRLDENKCQCFWCSNIFQGINDTKAMAHVLGTKGMHIKSCYEVMDKAHLIRYQELQNFNATRKGVS